MAANRFRKCAQAITDAEIDALAELAGSPLPDSFRAHYLTYNGGVPERFWWDSLDENSPYKVNEFFPISRGRRTLESIFNKLRSKKQLPDGLLPFAQSGTNQYFCLDLKNGCVLLYIPESVSQDDALDDEEPRSTKRKLTQNFNEFVKGLVSEDELD